MPFRLRLFTSTCLILAGTALQAQTPPAGDSLVRRISAKYRLPGFSVAVARPERPTWRWQTGAATHNTTFRVGSVSKLFTTAIAARLLASGRLGLDTQIAAYLSELPPAYGRLTARQLAGHLAGVRHYGPGEYVNQTPFQTITATLPGFLKDSLLSVPGAKYLYSSFGFNLLGAVLEAAASRSFDELLRSEVVVPLRLQHTSLEPSGRLAAGEAEPFTLDSLGNPQPSIAQDLSDRWPSGGVVASAEDLVRFALGTFSTDYLPDSARRLLLTSQRTSGGAITRIGLGWRIAEDSLARPYLHHGGSSIGGRAFLLVYPGLGVAVALLANTEANFGEAEALAFARLALNPSR